MGHPVKVLVGEGQQSDYVMAPALLEQLKAGAVIADKGYDADYLVDRIESMGAKAVIPSRSYRNKPRLLDKDRYKNRNQVERFFCRLKNFRRIATRYDKTQTCFLAFVHLASTYLWIH
jgi:putative transposase